MPTIPYWTKKTQPPRIRCNAREFRRRVSKLCFAPPDNWETGKFSLAVDHNQIAVENRDLNGGYASKSRNSRMLDGLGYRILWVVSYVDTGEVREEYCEEWEAKERCEELLRPVSSVMLYRGFPRQVNPVTRKRSRSVDRSAPGLRYQTVRRQPSVNIVSFVPIVGKRDRRQS